MGHYLRYITTDSRPITLELLASTFHQLDKAYLVYQNDTDLSSGDLYYKDTVLGVLEINKQGEEIYEEDIIDLKELITSSDNVRVQDTLDSAKAIIAIEAIWQGNDSEVTLEKLEPLWDWLFENYNGLLQIDNEGFYDQQSLILELNLKI